MKTRSLLYFVLTLCCFTAVMSGCKDNSFLDLKDPDAFDDTKFYRDSADMNGLLSASYASLRGAFDKMFFVTEMKSDNATTNDVGSSGGLYYNFVNHTVSSSNTIPATTPVTARGIFHMSDFPFKSFSAHRI